MYPLSLTRCSKCLIWLAPSLVNTDMPIFNPRVLCEGGKHSLERSCGGLWHERGESLWISDLSGVRRISKDLHDRSLVYLSIWPNLPVVEEVADFIAHIQSFIKVAFQMSNVESG
jgi:hypothetical protein